MKVVHNVPTQVACACAAFLFSMGVQSAPIMGATVAGTTSTYLETSPGVVTLQPPTPANVVTALTGAGNVELGKYGLAQGSLTGHFGNPAQQVTLSSLSLLDWTANGNALAQAYINDAAASIGASLNGAQLAAALNVFLNVDLQPGAGTFYAWQYLSDPNVSDVNLDGNNVVVGLDGLLDAEDFLDGLFLALGADAPDGSQASEVVKVTYLGETKYLYGFDAVPTGYVAADGKSYTGRFTVPEPSTVALLGLGILGLGLSRARKAK